MNNSESKVINSDTVEKQVEQLLHKNKPLESDVVRGYDFNKGVDY